MRKLNVAIIVLSALTIPMQGYDFDAVPDMTWVSFGNSPRSAKGEFRMIYDPFNNVLISGFGCLGGGEWPGAVSSCYSSDTYEFNPETEKWTETLSYQCSGGGGRPGNRCTFGFGYSSRDKKVLLFSGTGGTPDLWLYDAATNRWTFKLKETFGKDSQYGLIPCYDKVTDCFYSFDYAPTKTHGLPGQMYKYSISTNKWISTNSANPPKSSWSYAMAISEERRIIVLIPTSNTGTYVYKIDENRWIKLDYNTSANPGSRYRSGLAYDIVNDIFLLMAGKENNDDLWVLELDQDNNSGTWREITGKVKDYPATWQGVKSSEALCYDEVHNVFWIDGHWRGLNAFRYKAGNTTLRQKKIMIAGKPGLVCSPNPFNSKMKIAVSCPALAGSAISRVNVHIYNINGRIVKKLTVPPGRDRQLIAGITWTPKGLAKGIYLVSMRINGRTLSQKIILK